MFPPQLVVSECQIIDNNYWSKSSNSQIETWELSGIDSDASRRSDVIASSVSLWIDNSVFYFIFSCHISLTSATKNYIVLIPFSAVICLSSFHVPILLSQLMQMSAIPSTRCCVLFGSVKLKCNRSYFVLIRQAHSAIDPDGQIYHLSILREEVHSAIDLANTGFRFRTRHQLQ